MFAVQPAPSRLIASKPRAAYPAWRWSSVPRLIVGSSLVTSQKEPVSDQGEHDSSVRSAKKKLAVPAQFEAEFLAWILVVVVPRRVPHIPTQVGLRSYEQGKLIRRTNAATLHGGYAATSRRRPADSTNNIYGSPGDDVVPAATIFEVRVDRKAALRGQAFDLFGIVLA